MALSDVPDAMQTAVMKLACCCAATAAAVIFTLVATSCHSLPRKAPAGTFESVRPVLERNCLHCHGALKLPHMVSFADTAALAKLRGPGLWIWPAQPEKSRLWQVVTASDTTPGAMPPTGHAISPAEADVIRSWITSGAPLPAENVPLTPHGAPVRSR